MSRNASHSAPVYVSVHFLVMPTNNVQALLAQDIPDPTDFSATNLRQLDASFRCTICGEFFDAPISLACGHCFCSLVRNDNHSAVTMLSDAFKSAYENIS